MSFLSLSHDQHNPKIKINLVPQDPFFDTIIGKTLRWALSVGRYIVIFTELMVILSFVARFTLDRQLTNINDSIHHKKITVESYGDLENKVRLAQAKLDQYKQIEQQENIVDIFPALAEITPAGVKLDQLTISSGKISVKGSTALQQSLNTFINNFQLSPHFFNINVGHIEIGNRRKPGFNFSITAETKVEKPNK